MRSWMMMGLGFGMQLATPLALCGGAWAQANGNSVPSQIGNRANGFSYQPTPSQVGPEERAAGVAPNAQQQKQTNDELFRLDAQSLKNEGLSTQSVPGHGGGR
jgi:hypothetical protein